MKFVSYAQNNEDVMLARVFRGLDAGFYIDVGAQDPRIDSVTKAFYDRGWRGINIEPVEFWYQKLCLERPRDINLCMAAGDREGLVDFYEVPDTGLSTSSAEFAQRHRVAGYALTASKARVRSLDTICAEHGVQVVHFLKIDAEGDEAKVLQGIDLGRLRPWIILVEATEPNSSVSTHAQWESLIVDRGYDCVYNDGLNRFYLASEHAALADAFATPPSVFDDFVQRELVDCVDHADVLGKRIAQIEELSHRRAEQIDQLDRLIVEKDDALAGARAFQADAQARLSRLQEVVAERESSLSALEGVVIEREASLSVLQGVLVEREASLSLLRGVVVGHEIELQSRIASIAALAARLGSSEQAVATLSRTLVDAHAARRVSEAGWTAALAGHEATLAALAQTQKDFQEVISSRSWRMTGPLRRIITQARAARGYCARASRRLASLAWLGSVTALASNWLPGIAGSGTRSVIGQAAPVVVAIEPRTEPPRALPISEDAEQILSRCPVLDQARTSEAAR